MRQNKRFLGDANGHYDLLEDIASELLDSVDLMFFTVFELQTSLSETEGCYRVVAFLSTDLLNRRGGGQTSLSMRKRPVLHQGRHFGVPKGLSVCILTGLSFEQQLSGSFLKT